MRKAFGAPTINKLNFFVVVGSTQASKLGHCLDFMRLMKFNIQIFMQKSRAIILSEFYSIRRLLWVLKADITFGGRGIMGGKLILKQQFLVETIVLPGIKAVADKTTRRVLRSPNYSASQVRIYWKRHPKHVHLCRQPTRAIRRSTKLEVSSCDNGFNLKVMEKQNRKLDFQFSNSWRNSWCNSFIRI